jgi:hypothetical protein
MIPSQDAALVQSSNPAGVASAIGLLRARNTMIAAGAFVLALAVFTVFHIVEMPKTGFWTDELFSFWAGDPSLSFGDAFFQRILPDTNGPIYFSLVHVAQSLGFEGRAAFLAINLPVLAILLGLILWRGWRHGALAEALWTCALFLVTASALAYIAEGRVYGMTMATAAVMAFVAGVRITSPAMQGREERRDMIICGVLAFLASWMHLYGTLFAGSIGAALIVAGWFAGRRWDLMRLGLVLGVSTVIGFITWIAIAFPMFSRTASQGFWLPFNMDVIKEAAWMMKEFMVGFTPVLAVAAAFIGGSLFLRASRPAALLTIVTAVLFIGLPIMASLHTVIFTGRYLLSGAPALIILFFFVLRAHLPQVLQAGAPAWIRAVAAAGAVTLVSASVTGVPTASWHFANRWDWRGMDVIAPLLPACQEAEVRVLNTSLSTHYGFTYLLEGALTHTDAAKARSRDVADINCAVVAWGEHNIDAELDRNWWSDVTLEGALVDFNLTNTSNIPLDIRRHVGGLVIVRTDLTPAAQ